MAHLQAVILQNTRLREIVRDAQRLEIAGIKYSTNIMRYLHHGISSLQQCVLGRRERIGWEMQERRTKTDTRPAKSFPRYD